MNNENYLNETFKTIGSILVVILPIIQFGFISLPEKISSLYIIKESFFFTSLITLLLSIFIIFWYRSNPHFKIIFSKKQQKKYFNYINSLKQKDDIGHHNNSSEPIELPPFQIDANRLALIFMAFFLLTGLGFIFIGLNYNSINITPLISFIQSFLYILTFSSAIYVLIHFSYQEYQRKQWKRNREERIQRAINLAVENKAFKILPQINFVAMAEQNMSINNFSTPKLIVQVEIDNKKYNIFTNLSADELFEVSEIIEE